MLIVRSRLYGRTWARAASDLACREHGERERTASVPRAHTRSRRDHEPLDDNANPGSVDSTARGSDFQHDLEIAMLKLSESERAVVTLCLGSSLTHDEAANVLQLPIGTVKTHLLRGREKLRNLLAEWKS